MAAQVKMTVLLVDDDAPSLELYRLAFEMHGHRVLTASTGTEGVEVFKTERPDVVMMDLILGDMVGTEAIEQMRKDGEAGFYLLSEAEPLMLKTAATKSGVPGFRKLELPVNEVVKRVSEDFAGRSS